MEGNQYRCTWKRTPDGHYITSLVTKGDVAGSGKTFEDARLNLAMEIIAKYGDGEAVLEFVTKPPANAFDEKYGHPGIVSLSGNTEIDPPINIDEMFSKAKCPTCGSPRGSRTSKQLVFDKPLSADGSFFSYGRCTFPLFSEDFVNLIAPTGPGNVHFLQVAQARGRKDFFEVQGNLVAEMARNLAIEQSRRSSAKYWGSGCLRCGHKSHPYVIKGCDFTQFVHRTDLPVILPEIFLLGCSPEVQLCLKQDYWLQLLKKKNGTKRITSSRIGVI